jgi:hypothetical protein
VSLDSRKRKVGIENPASFVEHRKGKNYKEGIRSCQVRMYRVEEEVKGEWASEEADEGSS